MPLRHRACLVLGILMPLGAGPSRAVAQDTSAVRAQPARADADLLTREQFDASAYRTAWDVVQARRPNWLRQRSGSRPIGPLTQASGDSSATARPGSPTQQQRGDDPTTLDGSVGVQVYLDGMRMGDLQQLRNIPASQVWSIRRYNGSAAQFRFGNGHADGVLSVSTHAESDRR